MGEEERGTFLLIHSADGRSVQDRTTWKSRGSRGTFIQVTGSHALGQFCVPSQAIGRELNLNWSSLDTKHPSQGEGIAVPPGQSSAPRLIPACC